MHNLSVPFLVGPPCRCYASAMVSPRIFSRIKAAAQRLAARFRAPAMIGTPPLARRMWHDRAAHARHFAKRYALDLDTFMGHFFTRNLRTATACSDKAIVCIASSWRHVSWKRHRREFGLAAGGHPADVFAISLQNCECRNASQFCSRRCRSGRLLDNAQDPAPSSFRSSASWAAASRAYSGV
jgi:hypothetical protein